MSGRGRASFEKRRKEMARKEKQRLKAERKAQRKLAPPSFGSLDDLIQPLDDVFEDTPSVPSGPETPVEPRE